MSASLTGDPPQFLLRHASGCDITLKAQGDEVVITQFVIADGIPLLCDVLCVLHDELQVLTLIRGITGLVVLRHHLLQSKDPRTGGERVL